MKLILMILCFETCAAMRFRWPPPPLYRAIKNSNVAAVRKLATRHTVNKRFDNPSPPVLYPLKFAIKQRKCEVVKALLEAGAEVNPSLERNEKPPLFIACRGGKRVVPIVELLLDHGADSTVLVNGQDVFNYCIERRAWSVAKYLLDRPDVIVDVNRIFIHVDGTDDEKISIFMRCCRMGYYSSGNYGLMKAMLEKKNPDLGLTDGNRRTPIFHVAWDKTGNLARIMIAKGADVNHQDVSGATPILEAIAFSNANMVRVLIENGANPNTFSISFRPINVEIKEYSICAAFNNLRRYSGGRLFSPAVTDVMLKCVRILLRAGADLTVENAKRGKTIMDDIIDTISPLKCEKILPYTPILLDLLEMGFLKLEQWDNFDIFSIISPREHSFGDYFQILFYTVRPVKVIFDEQALAADFKGVIKKLEEYYISDFCAVLMKYYERCNKIRLPRVYESVVEDKVFEIYYAERERIFAQSYLNTIPYDLLKFIWMDAMNPEVAEKCKLRGSSLRVINLLRLDMVVKEEDFNVSTEELRLISNDLVDELEPKLTEGVEEGETCEYEYSPKYDEEDVEYNDQLRMALLRHR